MQWASIATILNMQNCSFWSSTYDGRQPISNQVILWELLSYKGDRWDLLVCTSPMSIIQGVGPVGSCAHLAGVSVCANPLQHTGRGPMVEGQLPGAVATHPNPHGPQQHSHARHVILSWRCHRCIMVGLSLKGEEGLDQM